MEKQYISNAIEDTLIEGLDEIILMTWNINDRKISELIRLQYIYLLHELAKTEPL